ncbi:Piwi-like protein 3 [Saguinus oedipus]|uniref:Piwi-like protein 3 n=1 Tax=Saguinus oedipus TaxID=9490 RepID=A0ABQ9WHW6_SAGOE|nr:Piwi-like protein 3 [Saguinus oedipus]
MGITMRRAHTIQVDGHADSYTNILRKYTRSALQMIHVTRISKTGIRQEQNKAVVLTPHQCVVKRTIEKAQAKTIITKIAQQMNCKMGGALWKVETNVQRTMFIGIDCFHDIVNRQKSIAGFVASTNAELTKWYSQCVIQATGEELVNELQTCLKAALDVWCENESSMPRSIIVYRDGVGDGQLQALLDQEAKQMSTYLKTISPNKYDFFIVSQSVKEGTVTPTHYNVIYDTIGLSPDRVQRLTYCLCHMYYNLPGTIRVPAPCHYAHKLAYLVGQSIHEKPNRSLSTLLFYL